MRRQLSEGRPGASLTFFILESMVEGARTAQLLVKRILYQVSHATFMSYFLVKTLQVSDFRDLFKKELFKAEKSDS